MIRRTPGACAGCIRSKRKCDHQLPRCTNCVKRDVPCEKKQFKQWKILQWTQSDEPSDVRDQISSPSFSAPTELELSQPGCLKSSSPPAVSPPLVPSLSIFSPSWSELPDRMFLWQNFVEKSSHIFQCWDPDETSGTGTKSQDPLSSLLPAMAAFDETLRSATLAFSAHYYRISHPAQAARFSTVDFFSEAVESLISSKRDTLPAAPDSFLPSLAAILLLYRVDSHSRHSLLSLARSAVSCIVATNSRALGQDSRYRALMALLAWTDICTYSSVIPQPSLTVEDDYPLIFSTYEEDHGNFSPAFDGWVTHPIYAFSRGLISPLLRMGRLVQARRTFPSAWPDDLEACTRALEVDLLTAYEESISHLDPVTTKPLNPATDPQALLHANAAMFSAAFIMFYTRLRDIPFTAPFIRQQVSRIVAESAQIDSSSVSSRAAVFPLFIAGCEAVDATSRGLVKERLGAFVHYLGCPIQPIFEQLEEVWRIRDEEPGLSWVQWTEKIDVSLNRFIVW